MEKSILKFIKYLHKTRKSSVNTELSYRRDLEKLAQYLVEEQGMTDWTEVTATNLNSYILYLEDRNYAVASVSRSVASMRTFFHYLVRTHYLSDDPSYELKAPKVEKKAPDILTGEEISALISQPDCSTPKGLRDKAMLVLLCGTGIRVSELIGLKLGDINLEMGYISCRDRTGTRAVPFGPDVREAVETYMSSARHTFVGDRDPEALFLNCSGKMMSRQGFWKILKGYAENADISRDITPHTLRHTFAAHMLAGGADVYRVKELLGYSDVSQTQIYAMRR